MNILEMIGAYHVVKFIKKAIDRSAPDLFKLGIRILYKEGYSRFELNQKFGKDDRIGDSTILKDLINEACDEVDMEKVNENIS